MRSVEDEVGRHLLLSVIEGNLSTLSALIPLQRSDVQMQALIVSDSTAAGLHSSTGSTGSSKLPRRILVGKHSLMTEVSALDFFHE